MTKTITTRDELLHLVADIMEVCTEIHDYPQQVNIIRLAATRMYQLLNESKEKELSVGQKKRGAQGTDNPKAVVPNERMLEEWRAAIVRAASREEVL